MKLTVSKVRWDTRQVLARSLETVETSRESADERVGADA